MKYLIFILILAIAWLITSASPSSQSRVSQKPVDTPTSIPEIQINPRQFMDIPYRRDALRIAWYDWPQKATLRLIPNYSEKRPSNELLLSQKCTRGINAGFYTKEGKPLGLVVSNSTKISEFETNQTLNGIFWVDETGNSQISRLAPEFPVLAIQAGPILIEQKLPKSLSLTSDELARRSVVAVSQNQMVYFISVYSIDNTFVGPLLADLPELISTWANKEQLTITDALNLDGGSASMFYDNEFKLQELNAVGSILCIQL